MALSISLYNIFFEQLIVSRADGGEENHYDRIK